MIGFVVLCVHSRMTAVVEKSSESELEESVDRMFPVIQRIVHFIFVSTISQFIRHNRIEIRRIGGETNLGDVGRRFASKASLKIYSVEEGMRFQFSCTPSTRTLIGRGTEANDQIGCLRRQVCVIRDL